MFELMYYIFRKLLAMLKEFKDYFGQCSRDEQDRIIDHLYHIIHTGQVSFDTAAKNQKPVCLHGKSDRIVAVVKHKDVKKYLCQACHKNFRETTGTAIMWLKKKHLFKKYLFCMLLGKSLRATSLEVGISLQPSHNWRHKVSALFAMVSAGFFVGIMESKDFFILESQKGNKELEKPARKRGGRATKRGISEEQIAIIASCDRSENTDIKVVSRGRISTEDIAAVLANKTENVEVLCTDSYMSYTSYAKRNKLSHNKINAAKRQKITEKVYHVQNVKNKISRLRDWMQGFQGVATKYLQNYLNWFMVLEKIKPNNNKAASFISYVLMSRNAWYQWKSLSLNNAFFGT